MTLPRVLLGLFLILIAPGAWAQYPEPRGREEPESLDAASRLFDAGRWEEAVEAFEAAARTGAVLPPLALRCWGIAASEAGRPLAAYIRLRQYLAVEREPVDRENLGERVGRARDALLTGAAQFSRLLASMERRPDVDSAGERHVVRAAAREGEVSIEGLSGFRVEAPLWRRAEEIPLGPYLDLVRRLLDAPAFIDQVPAQMFDPNEPGPRHAAVVRLVIGEEERRLEALRGEPYERLKEVVGAVVDFARRVPPLPDPESKTPPAPPKPGKKRR